MRRDAHDDADADAAREDEAAADEVRQQDARVMSDLRVPVSDFFHISSCLSYIIYILCFPAFHIFHAHHLPHRLHLVHADAETMVYRGLSDAILMRFISLSLLCLLLSSRDDIFVYAYLRC